MEGHLRLRVLMVVVDVRDAPVGERRRDALGAPAGRETLSLSLCGIEYSFAKVALVTSVLMLPLCGVC